MQRLIIAFCAAIAYAIAQPVSQTCVYRKSDSAILVMKSAEDRL